MAAERPHILILGAGINGCALARELLLNDVSVTLVDQADISSGATAYSSRLIHGGLRYLEYGEFDLVRESLGERTRLLQLAPQFVRPLQLFIPVDNRWGGLLSSAGKFFGWPKLAGGGTSSRRGAWLVQMGLWFYDRYARDPSLPKHRRHTATEPGAVAVDAEKFRWLLSYFDAQVLYPERFTLALLIDAQQIAAERGLQLRVYSYHQAVFDGQSIQIRRTQGRSHSLAHEPVAPFEPSAVVNATGAWVDLTQDQLGLGPSHLMGGTKGSHFISYQSRLRECLGDRGIYAEAPDGRPVFILPFGAATLVGTTDEPYTGDPADAVASEHELEYLIGAVNEIMPRAGIARDDVDLHYSGIRPLPRVDASTPGAITRRHWMQEIPDAPLPLYAVIGGKLTTCRSLAEQCAATLLARLGSTARADSRTRGLPGADGFPRDPVDERARIEQLGWRFNLDENQVRTLWSLGGTHYEKLIEQWGSISNENLPGTHLPVDIAQHVITHEWVDNLDDLIERRLMLVFAHELSEACVRQLAELMASAGKLDPADIEPEVARAINRLARHFGKRISVDQISDA